MSTIGVRVSGAERGPISAPKMRRSNAMHVLTVLRRRKSVSRTDLAHATGLTVPTVHRVIADLQRLDLAREAAPPPPVPGPAGSGRRPVWYAFNPCAAGIVGVDVGNETTRAALARADGTIVCAHAQPTAEIGDRLEDGIATAVATLVATAGPEAGPLVGVGVGVAGVVDPHSGTIARASVYRAWDGLPLRALLERRLSCPVSVEQDDHLSALAEVGEHGAAPGANAAVVLNVGKGIGAGVIIAGQIVRGTRGAAGRVAWWPVESADGAARTVGDVLVADALVRAYAARGGTRPVVTGKDLCEVARDGDGAAQAIVDEAGAILGTVFQRLAATVDPSIMVLGGGLAYSFDLFAPAIKRALATLPFAIDVAPSRLGHDAVVLGGLIVALRHVDTWLEERLRLM